MKLMHAAAVIAVLWSGFAFAATVGAGQLPRDSIIRSAEDLERYLSETALGDSVLDAMPLGARKRFLAQLRFGAGGLGGFGTADLKDTLTRTQIGDVLALFGLQRYGEQIQGLATTRVPRDFESDFELRFDAFNTSLELQPAPSAAGIGASYRQLVDGREPIELARTLEPYDRALLFRAMLRALQMDALPGQADQSQQVLALMHSHAEDTPTQASELFYALVALRKFDLADQLAREYPEGGMSTLPVRAFAAEAKTGLNTILQVSVDGRRLSRETVDLSHGLHIVVVAGCHFARDAATAISASPELDRLFHRRAIWLAPASERISDVAEWNRQLPSQPIQIAWAERNWQQITSWEMPTFYVFRDGTLLTQWSGWAADSGMDTLRRRLQEAGVRLAPRPGVREKS